MLVFLNKYASFLLNTLNKSRVCGSNLKKE
jgi:hypothetical protein